MSFSTKVWISLGVGIVQGVAYALAFHSLHADAHLAMLVVLAAGGASGWFVYKKALAG